jgi:glutathione S-transferase
MAIKLYDLAGADPERRFSPFCWRTRLALAHKGLEVEAVPWRFTEKDMIAFSGQGRVPVIQDGDRVVYDSWTISEYLEERYADRPSLFGGAGGKALTRFVAGWTDAVLHPGIFRLILPDVFVHLHEKDRDYFRTSREQRIGTALEAFAANRDADVIALRQSLQPLRATLQAQPFVAGAAPAYADHIVFGGFQWARATSRFALLEADDPVALWRGRMLDSYGGLARRAPGYD